MPDIENTKQTPFKSIYTQEIEDRFTRLNSGSWRNVLDVIDCQAHVNFVMQRDAKEEHDRIKRRHGNELTDFSKQLGSWTPYARAGLEGVLKGGAFAGENYASGLQSLSGGAAMIKTFTDNAKAAEVAGSGVGYYNQLQSQNESSHRTHDQLKLETRKTEMEEKGGQVQSAQQAVDKAQDNLSRIIDGLYQAFRAAQM